MPINCKEYNAYVRLDTDYKDPYYKRRGTSDRLPRGTIPKGCRALYTCWLHMMHRCYNPDCKPYKDYGGRGIRVWRTWCYRPSGLLAFIKWAKENGYKHGLEIDRKNNDKGYSPENCRWASPHENQSNKRNSVNIDYNGESINIFELWARVGNKSVSPGTAFWRFRKGVPPLIAVSMPSIPRRRVKDLCKMPNELVDYA